MKNEQMKKDIAVVGMAGRFPEAENLERFEHNLRTGRDSVRQLSEKRMTESTIPGGKQYQPLGFIEDIDKFDHGYFGISRKEARFMDPHQRMLLEVILEAMENGGYNAEKMRGTRTAVFVGGILPQYYQLATDFDPTILTGNLNSAIAGRVSREFDFQGTAAMVDTACSSSLLSIHMACNELLLGDADYAIACGVNLELLPKELNSVLDVGVASADGRTKTFSDQAEGTAAGEAVAAVILKPLSEALKDGDLVHAVIKSTAVNQDAGRSASFTAPDSAAQSEVIRTAWRKAGIDPLTVSYVEAHGTATNLGDPIEIEGLKQAFASFTGQKQFCAVSAVKPNIGHGGPAAGITSFIKAVLSLKNKVLYPSINFETPNLLIGFEQSPVFVVDRLRDWDHGPKPLRAGVSSFGIIGTNCHIVLEEAPAEQFFEESSTDRRIVCVTSKSAPGLQDNLRVLGDYLERSHELLLADISKTLNEGRQHHGYRWASVVHSVEELRRSLAGSLAPGPEHGKEKTGNTWIFFPQEGSVREEDPFRAFPHLKDVYQEIYSALGERWNVLQRQAFARQYVLYGALKDLGITSGKVLGTGIGKHVISFLRNEPEPLQRFDALGIPPSIPEDIQQRIQSFIKGLEEGDTVIDLSMGDNPVSSHLLDASRVRSDIAVLTFRQGVSAGIHEAIKQWFTKGGAIRWETYTHHFPGRKIELPPYQFQRVSCWIRDAREMQRQRIAGWMYSLEWIKDTGRMVSPVSGKRYLLFADTGGLGDEIARLLQVQGNEVITVFAGDVATVIPTGTSSWQIDPLTPGQYTILQEKLRETGQPIDGIIHLGACDPLPPSVSYEHGLPAFVLAQFFMMKAFSGHFEQTNFTLAFAGVDSHWIPGMGDKPNAAKHLSWAMAKAVMSDYPGMRSCFTDFSSAEVNVMDNARRFVHDLSDTASPDFRAYRKGERYVQVLKKPDLMPGNDGMVFKTGGCYLVTGGLSGIGLEVCKRIVSEGGVRLAIFGRTDITTNTKEAKAKALELEKLRESEGCTVEYMCVDLASEEAIRNAMEHVQKRIGSIDGIVHSAGINSKWQHLTALTCEDLEVVAAPKILGTRWLVENINEAGTPFVVLFSSGNSIVAQKHTLDYTLANAYLDAMGWELNERGIRTLVINWGSWGETGMGYRSRKEQMLFNADAVIRDMRSVEGITAMDMAMASGAGNLVIADFDVQKFALNPFFKVENGKLPERKSFDKRVYPPGTTTTQQRILDIWYEVLQAEHIRLDDNFMKLGGHSLMARQVLSRIHGNFSLELKFKDIFQYPTVEALSQRIDELLAKGNDTESAGMNITKLEEQPYYDLSFSQQRLWILHQVEEDMIAYNIVVAYRITGHLQPQLLEKACELLVQRHESLRTNFVMVKGEAKQVISDSPRHAFHITDLSTQADPELFANDRINRLAEIPFNLEQDQLIRFELLRVRQYESIFILSVHHMVSDGWSMNVIFRDIFRFYKELLKNSQYKDPTPLTIQYKDFAAWQRQLIEKAGDHSLRGYWHKKLKGPRAVVDLRGDRKRPEMKTYHGDAVAIHIEGNRASRVIGFARDNSLSLYMLLLASVKLLIFRYTGERDLAVGGSIAGRNHSDLEDQVGFFLNMLVYRDHLDPSETVSEFLKKVEQTTLEAYDHQNYPFDMLVTELIDKHDRSRSPFFDVLVVLQNFGLDPLEKLLSGGLQDLKIEALSPDFKVSKFDIIFMFTEMPGGGLQCRMEYNTDIFDTDTVTGFGRELADILTNIPGAIDLSVSDFLTSLHMALVTDRKKALEITAGKSISEDF